MSRKISLSILILIFALGLAGCKGCPRRVGVKEEAAPPAAALATPPAAEAEKAAPSAAAPQAPAAKEATPPAVAQELKDDFQVQARLDDHGRRLDSLEAKLAELEGKLAKAKAAPKETPKKAAKAAKPKKNGAGAILLQKSKALNPPQTKLVILGAAGTLVKINGKDIGSVPQTILDPLPGDYQIELTQPGFAPYAQLVRVEKGENVTVNLSQKSEKQESRPLQ